MKKILFLILLVMCSLGMAAQIDTVVKKFGDVSPEDFEPTDLELMGGYKAIILQNQRSNYFEVLFNGSVTNHYGRMNDISGQLRFVNTHHIRYKALEDNFLDNNKFVIPFSGRFAYEFVPKVKARVYSLERNKVSIKKIKFKDLKYVDRDSIKSRLEIHFPNIKKGDIVDIEYSVASFNCMNPDKWDFHHEYPCKVSQVVADFPEFFQYDFRVTGDNIPVNQNVTQHIAVLSDSKQVLMTYNHSRIEQQTFRFTADQNVFTAVNTLPVDTVYNYMPQKDYNDAQLYMRPKRIIEPVDHSGLWVRSSQMMYMYMDPSYRYLSQQEASSNNSQRTYVMFESDNWKRFNKRLRQSSHFWKPILKSFELDGKLSEIFDNADSMDSLSFMRQIYDYVASNVKWDGTFANRIETKPEDVLKKGSGSSAEINATLLALLRRGGFVALPVLSATRDYGMVDSSYVNMRQFNNILAYVSFEQNDTLHGYLLDATSPNRRFDVLNIQNINNMYVVMDLDKTTHSILNYPPYPDNMRIVSAEYKDGGCLVSEKNTGIFAAENCDYLYSHNVKQYVDSQYDFAGADVRQISSSNKDGVFEFSAQVSTGKSNAKGLMRKLIGDNPFPELVRTVPVDFVFPRKYKYVVYYSDDALSFDNKVISALDDNLVARIYCNQTEKPYSLHIDVNIKKPMFSLSEYDYVRSFFENIYNFFEN